MNRFNHRLALSILRLPMAILLAGGCASSLEKAPADDMRTLPGRFAEEPVTKPLTAVEAFIGPTEFYISYKSEDGLVHSGGNWSNKIDLTALGQGPEGDYAGPYILPLEYQQRARWAEVPEAPIVPRILGSKYWNRFIDTVFESVLPKAAMTGIVMHFGEDDYFLYYNDINNFEARLITDKPENYVVAETIDFAEFNRRAQPVMDEFLKQEGIEDRRLVFSTGDAGAYSLPFVYVDRDIPLGIFVRYSPAPRQGPVASKGSQVAQSAGHLAHSHLGGLFSRPVSSVFRLLFVAKDAAVETMRPSWLVTLESQPIPELNGGPGMDLDDWELQLDRITRRPATRGTIDYLVDGEEFFVRFIDAISTAQKSVDIRTYIFDNDDFAEKVGRLLRRRADEGIDIRVLLDGLGTIVATGADDASLPERYEAPESVRLFLEKESSIDVRQSRNPWLVAGDHVKTTIIDGQVAFAGGMNIGREYRFGWHDLMMELRGPVVDELNNEFNKAWAHAGMLGDAGYVLQRLKPNPRNAEDLGYPLRVLHTRPGVSEIFNAQRAAIRNAQEYIYIQNAYLTDDAMLYELAKARRRGVDVRVILPLVGNHGPINKSNALAANAMLEHGIRVFVYPGMSHVKAAIFDGWACLGSANWDKLSFRTNKELNIATSHPEYVDDLFQRVFKADFEKSVELTEPFPKRWSDHLVEVVADYVL
ncbi:MAG: phosphatidylserine/phosphatidylglycerophosphate/cardiolipin synthase family protein [Gammaproteobacteria bacterium]|nr:phosphatidylserine/phosphatidylglycerophosphate/cardiolipin synthase family protein [Gammaproteobacteria bacterium]